MSRLLMTAVLVLPVWGPHLSRRARAEPPSCFPERTVLWAVQLVDADGKTFGGIRAGQTVRIVEDFVGADGDEAQIEITKPITVRARVPRKSLLAFTRQELEQKGGFVRWTAGAPVVLGKPENGIPRLFLADPHYGPEKSPSALSPCSTVQGTPIAIAYRDACHGARPVTDAVTHGKRKVFWKNATMLTALDGADAVEIPRTMWVYLVERGPDMSTIEFRDWSRHMLYLGKAPTKGMRYVPSNIGQGSEHLCCEGLLFFRPAVRAEEGRRATIVSQTPLSSAPGGAPIATLASGLAVSILQEENERAFVAYRWPGWDRADFTFQLHGWIDARALHEAGSNDDAAKASPKDAVELTPEADRNGGSR